MILQIFEIKISNVIRTKCRLKKLGFLNMCIILGNPTRPHEIAKIVHLRRTQIMQNHAEPCGTMQNHAKLGQATRNYNKQLETTWNYADSPRITEMHKTMQNNL